MAGPCVLRKTSRGPSSARPGGWARLVAMQVRGRGERAVFLGAAALPTFLCQDPGQGESTDEKGGGWLCHLLSGGSGVRGLVSVWQGLYKGWAGPWCPGPRFPLQSPGGLFFRMLLLRSGLPGGSEGKQNLPAVWETQVRSLGQEDSPREGNDSPLCVLAWRIPGTEEHGGLQPMGSQRVGQD